MIALKTNIVSVVYFFRTVSDTPKWVKNKNHRKSRWFKVAPEGHITDNTP